ncbi:MAG: hypothetical protein JNK30_21350 [Phenylobacterium sp.]|uniref:hypothetical protein n=1 Tax=Phenylobacterium sp. TaxID=1871053 RepID=UPI001A647336|nr:hypothetical protein [Phenylobacterium sp.]MBL8773946.1 hypothetical protein [Phenylobacterium sp.]
MFAPTPVWDRKRKRRGGFAAARPTESAVAAEPRSFADPMAERPMSPERDVSRADQTTAYALGPAAVTSTTPRAEPVTPRTETVHDTAFAAPPPRSATGVKTAKSRGMGSTAIAGAAVGVIALGAVGWFATRDNGEVPELTPGATTSEVAAAPLPPVDAPPAVPVGGERAANILPERSPASAEPAAIARAPAAAPVRTARARPAAAAADTQGVPASASAAIPDGPQPYSTLNPGAATTAVNPAPAPSVETAPAAEPIPSTPPTITPDPSTTTAPAETAPADPPQ